MKTIKRIVLGVALMLGTFTNYANNTELDNLLDTKKVRVVFKGAKKGHQLKIKDNNGINLHFENVSRTGNLIKFFDFSNLKDGNYTLELEKEFEIIIKSFYIRGTKVVFDGEIKEKIFKPVIRTKKNRLMITKINFYKKPLKVEIYYKNEMIYSDSIKGEKLINRVYKLDELKAGNYKVIIQNDGRSFSKNFKF